MTKHSIEAVYAFETQGPLHVGTGHGAAGLHRAMLRDQRGLPYIPGSTIKGRARYAAVRICDWMGLWVIKDAVADVRRDRIRSPNGPRGEPDLPARIFGYAWSRCMLRFGDARTDLPKIDPTLNDAERRTLRDRAHGLREVRTGAARSRLLGTVSHGHLYQSEVAPPGLIFRGAVRGYLACEEPADADRLVNYPVEALVLWLALHLMVEDGVGGNKSAGSGKLAWMPSGKIEMKVDGTLFAPKDGDVSDALEMLPLIEGEKA